HCHPYLGANVPPFLSKKGCKPSGLYAGHLCPPHFLLFDHFSCVNAYGMIFPKGLDFWLIFQFSKPAL
ncbi:hypothetical protein, partial [Candidatus Ichthyocystis sparus]|uniref:hypothetical protein n=1 Tax=Candidatus Ichthyocystis sparus TaxID=1561004 RepID=UPI001F5EF60F